MSDNTAFEVSGGGTKYRDAKALPTGTPVRIVSMEPKKSKFQRKAQEGEEEEDHYQTCVVFETLAKGETMPYEKGRAGSRVTVQPTPFGPGDKFVHYFGGIYAKDGGGWRLAERGGTYGFIAALRDLGVPISGKFENYHGLDLTLERVRGVGPQGAYFTPFPKAVINAETAAPEPAPVKKAPGKKIAKATKGNSAPAGKDNAYLALSEEDRTAVDEYVAETDINDVNPEDLVGVVAKDLAHAKSILEDRYLARKAQEAVA